jgi:hypothetical protein
VIGNETLGAIDFGASAQPIAIVAPVNNNPELVKINVFLITLRFFQDMYSEELKVYFK